MASNITTRPSQSWGNVTPFESPIDELIRGFFVKPLSFDSREWSGSTPMKVDVRETEKDYRVVAEMPGVRKEDISVSVDGSTVTISAEVKRETEQREGERVLRSERHYGKVQRQFSVAHPLDDANAQAKYADGVLELVLPKSEAALPKRIAVH